MSGGGPPDPPHEGEGRGGEREGPPVIPAHMGPTLP